MEISSGAMIGIGGMILSACTITYAIIRNKKTDDKEDKKDINSNTDKALELAILKLKEELGKESSVFRDAVLKDSRSYFDISTEALNREIENMSEDSKNLAESFILEARNLSDMVSKQKIEVDKVRKLGEKVLNVLIDKATDRRHKDD